MQALNTGGKLDAKVVNVGADSFRIKVTGKGHEHHEKELDLPREDFNGVAAATGAKHRESAKNPGGYKEPKNPPKPGDYVLFDADAYDEDDAPAADDSSADHSDRAASHAASAASSADRAEAAAVRSEKAAAAAAAKPAGN